MTIKYIKNVFLALRSSQQSVEISTKFQLQLEVRQNMTFPSWMSVKIWRPRHTCPSKNEDRIVNKGLLINIGTICYEVLITECILEGGFLYSSTVFLLEPHVGFLYHFFQVATVRKSVKMSVRCWRSHHYF